jgi:hypothetical protein
MPRLLGNKLLTKNYRDITIKIYKAGRSYYVQV